MAKKGDWVEIEKIILTPEQRAQTCPEDTKSTPYKVRMSGFLDEDAEVGAEAKVTSMIGRVHVGRVLRVNPSYTHSFGDTVAEILTIGTERDATHGTR